VALALLNALIAVGPLLCLAASYPQFHRVVESLVADPQIAQLPGMPDLLVKFQPGANEGFVLAPFGPSSPWVNVRVWWGPAATSTLGLTRLHKIL
jgi:hypothetical protein